MKDAQSLLLNLRKSQKGKASIPPLLIAAIAIAIIPIIATLFTGSREKVSLPTVAELPWCLPDPSGTQYDNPCTTEGSYECAPDGKQTVCVNGKTQATGSCCAQEVAPPPETAMSDTAAGCIFTLGYEKEGTLDPGLKEEAFAQLDLFREDILNGNITADELVQVITTGVTFDETKSKRRERFENPDSYTRKYKDWVNPYSKFLEGISTNFCYQDSSERDNKLTNFFYEDNPGILQTFQQLNPGDVSSPISIYHTSSEGKKEYATMMIYKEK